MNKLFYVYILKCSDNSFYTGITNNIEKRLIEHQTGKNFNSYTFSRLPVTLVWHQQYFNPKDAISMEKKIKGWTRRKKQALIDEDWDSLVKFSKSHSKSKKLKN